MDKKRLSRATIFMAVAVLFSKRTTCLRGIKEHLISFDEVESWDLFSGACLVQEGRIISTGYTGSPSGQPHCIDEGCIIGPTGGCSKTLHSEVNCILQAAKKGISVFHSTLYTTISPCLSCAKVIVSAGIGCVIYLGKYRDESGIEYLRQCGVPVLRFSEEAMSNVDLKFVNEIVKLESSVGTS